MKYSIYTPCAEKIRALLQHKKGYTKCEPPKESKQPEIKVEMVTPQAQVVDIAKDDIRQEEEEQYKRPLLKQKRASLIKDSEGNTPLKKRRKKHNYQYITKI